MIIKILDKIDDFFRYFDSHFINDPDDIPIYFFHNIKIYWTIIKRMFDYFPIIWHDFDFNGDVGMFKLMKKKLERLEPELVHLLSSKRNRKQIRVCTALLDRIISDEYENGVYEEHRKKCGELKITKEEKKQEDIEFFDKLTLAAKFKQRDIDYVFNILSKHLTMWWD